jgi:hypothetical protein
MSFIPEKAMRHVHAENVPGKDGKIVPIKPETASEDGTASSFNWVLGAAGAGVAVAAAAAALFTLRSSSARQPARRRTRAKTAKVTAPKKTVQRRTAKKATAAA